MDHSSGLVFRRPQAASHRRAVVYFCSAVLTLFAVVVAWFAILVTGHYPRGLFDFVVGLGRWGLRVQAYAFLLVTDSYPPFSLS